MKKVIIAILLCFLMAGCGSGPETPDSLMPMIVHEGQLYVFTWRQMPVEPAEEAIVGQIESVVALSETPSEEAQANFGTVGDEIALTTDGLLVIMGNEWSLFEKVE